MATEPPKISFHRYKDKREAVKIWLDQFDDWCFLQGWRDTPKPASNHDHWNTDKYAVEISALRLGMPPEVLKNVKSTMVPTMAPTPTMRTQTSSPWVWQNFILSHYSGHHTVLVERMIFLDTCKQQLHESVAEFEVRCKYNGLRCESISCGSFCW